VGGGWLGGGWQGGGWQGGGWQGGGWQGGGWQGGGWAGGGGSEGLYAMRADRPLVAEDVSPDGNTGPKFPLSSQLRLEETRGRYGSRISSTP
jgi:hypothetical protein